MRGAPYTCMLGPVFGICMSLVHIEMYGIKFIYKSEKAASKGL